MLDIKELYTSILSSNCSKCSKILCFFSLIQIPTFSEITEKQRFVARLQLQGKAAIKM